MEGINRLRFTDKSVEKAIKVLKKELPPSKGPAFLKRFKADIVLRNGDLFFKEKKKKALPAAVQEGTRPIKAAQSTKRHGGRAGTNSA